MVKRSEEEKVRVHIHMFKRDKERIDAWRIDKTGGERIKFSESVCMIVRKFLDQVEAKAMAGAAHPKLTEDDMEIFEK